MIEEAPTRICHVARDVEGTGGGEAVRQLVASHVRRGITVGVISDNYQSHDERVQAQRTWAGHTLRDWNASTAPTKLIRHFLQLVVFSVSATMRARAKKKQGWIIVNHNAEALTGDILVMHNVFTVELARDIRTQPRKIVRMLNPVATLRVFRELWLLHASKVKRVVAVSEACATEVASLGVDSDRCKTIPHGVDLNRFRPLDPIARQGRRADMGIAVDDLAILFVGHEFDRKGLPLVLEAAALLQPTHHLRVLIAGGRGDSISSYSSRAAKLGLASRVSFLGTRPDVETLYPAADVFVFPSRYETFGLVALESMACGTPVVMTDVGAARDVIVHSGVGRVTAADPHEIAEAIGDLFQLRQQDVSALCRSVAEGFTWDEAATAYEALAAETQVAGA